MKQLLRKINEIFLIIVLTAGVTILFLTLFSCSNSETSANKGSNEVYDRNYDVPLPNLALQLLKEGNTRFVNNQVLLDNVSNEKRKTLKEKGQKPFAVILTCSDSRVPPEIIFDQGLGDLFVIRVAGNVLDSVVTGSIEYAVEHLHSAIVVVLGHEKCGAVTATVEGAEVPGSIPSICNRIKPLLNKVKIANPEKKDIVNNVIDENVLEDVTMLESNKVLKDLTESGSLKIVGGVYHLESGEVTFF
jgi:carbonic anhydrase